MYKECKGFEVWYQRFYEDEFDLWCFTTNYLEANAECDILMGKDHVNAVKLMSVTTVQRKALSKSDDL